MAELADALDLGSSGRPCRFKSCYPHKQGLSRHLGCLGSPCFLRFDINADINGKDLGSEGIGVCTADTGIYIIGKLL